MTICSHMSNTTVNAFIQQVLTLQPYDVMNYLIHILTKDMHLSIANAQRYCGYAVLCTMKDATDTPCRWMGCKDMT